MRRRMVYDTGETIGKNRSKEQNVTGPDQTKERTSSQKIAFRLEPPDLRPSKAIAVILIDCGVEWCMIQGKQLVRTGRKNKIWRRHSKKNTLTSSQKIVLRLEPLDLRHSKAIATIVFKPCIDWSMIKLQQWVRRWGRKNKMWRHQTPQKNLPRHKNSLCHSSRRNHAAPRPLPSFPSKPTSIDVKYRWKNGLEEVERTKCGGTRPDKRTNLDTKNHFATGANGPTPLQGHCHHSHRNLNRLMYNTVETNG